MMDPRNPPAIVRESADLKALAAEINAAIQMGEQSAKVGAEQFRRAGLALVKAKASIPHGEWNKWLAANIKRNERQAQRWIKLAKSDAASDLKEQWSIICGHKDEPEPPPPVTSQFCERCQRVGPVKDCEACKALKKGKSGKEREPGDDSDAEAARLKKEKEDRAKQGKERFELRTFTAHLGHAAAELNKLAHEAGLEKETKPGFAPGVIVTPHHAAAKKHLSAARKEAQEWKEELDKK